MTKLALTLFTAFAFTAWSPSTAAADPRAALDQVLADAARVRIEAMQLADLLRDRRPDYAQVVQQFNLVQQHAAGLREAIRAVDVEAVSLVAADRSALERARVATDAMLALLENKARLLEDAEAAAKQRGLIRAKARGVVARAQLVEEQVSMVRG